MHDQPLVENPIILHTVDDERQFWRGHHRIGVMAYEARKESMRKAKPPILQPEDW